jgi:Transposase
MPIRQESTSGLPRSTWRFRRTGMRNQYGVLGASQRICERSPSGLGSAAFEGSRWNRPGVYWIPLWQVLADGGFEVCLVNARHFRNVPGKKTDVEDCQWLQFLHSVGLLRGSYRPDQAICGVRTLLRYRGELIQFAAQHIGHRRSPMPTLSWTRLTMRLRFWSTCRRRWSR